jgi:hypothetical protein
VRIEGNVKVLPSLDIAEAVPSLTETKLFIHLTEAQRAAAAAWNLQQGFPEYFWDALTRALSPVALERSQNTVLLRLSSLTERGSAKELAPTIVDPRYKAKGYRLQELTTYDLNLSYYRLVQQANNAPPVGHQYSVTNPADELQVSRRNIHIVGNYRAEKIWIAPLKPAQGPIEIAVEPTRVGQPDFVEDQTAAKTVGLKLPALIRGRRWPGTRIVNLVLFLVTAAASGYMLWRYFCADESTQKMILVIVASLIAVSINALKDVLLLKR